MAKVLIAEDDPLLSSILANKFQDAGFEVLAALDGAEAVDKIKSWKPDFILLDIMMPKKDGFVVLEETRDFFTAAHIPVLMLSNLGEQTDIDRAKTFGITDYLVKVNTTPKSILEKVQGMIKKG